MHFKIMSMPFTLFNSRRPSPGNLNNIYTVEISITLKWLRYKNIPFIKKPYIYDV